MKKELNLKPVERYVERLNVIMRNREENNILDDSEELYIFNKLLNAIELYKENGMYITLKMYYYKGTRDLHFEIIEE